MTASFISAPTIIKFLDNISYQINVTGAGSQGFFTVQASNDYQVDDPSNAVVNPGTWVDLQLSGIPSVAGINDSILISMNQMPFNAVRVAYTSTTAGAGECDIVMLSKQVGG